MSANTQQYDVVLSFAGPDRSVARDLAGDLKGRGLTVFFDEDLQHVLVGASLPEVLVKIFRDRGLFCVMLVSEAYARRPYPTLERRAALDRMLQNMEQEYILPIRLDDTWIDGLPRSTAYLDLRTHGIAGVGAIVAQKIASFRATQPSVPPRGEGPGAPLWRELTPGVSLPGWIVKYQISRFSTSASMKAFLRLLQRAELGGVDLVVPLLGKLKGILHPVSGKSLRRDSDFGWKQRVSRYFIVEQFFAFRQGPVNDITAAMMLEDPLDYDDFTARLVWYLGDRFVREYFRSFVFAGHVTDESFYNVLRVCAVLARGADGHGKEVMDIIGEYSEAPQWGYRRHAVRCAKLRWEAGQPLDDRLLSRIRDMAKLDPDFMVRAEAGAFHRELMRAEVSKGGVSRPREQDVT